MRLLLDTHALLWWLAGTDLTAEAEAAIANPRNPVFISAASAWEMSIKESTGKLTVDGDIVEHITAAGFDPLPITLSHGIAAGRLPPHHRDPFDRMLVAQAQIEGLTLVTRDPKLAQYRVPILTA